MGSAQVEIVANHYHLLIVNEDKEMCNSLEKILSLNGFIVSTVNSAQKGLSVLQNTAFDLIVCDITMPDMSGLFFLQQIGGKIPVIMMTACDSLEITRKAFKFGAKDCLVKPFDLGEILVVIRQNLHGEHGRLKFRKVDKILESHNLDFSKMLTLAEKCSGTDIPVLLTGESGSGKEIIARHIYENSLRNNKDFISINCAAIPETLLESELFGYEKGAFTGAASRKVGKFESADGGTVFLDEIGDMPLGIQAKMLQVLEDYSLSRLGGNDKINVNIRIIAATNKDIYSLVETGAFREDLFHRLNGIHLTIPPLRHRTEDVDMFIDFFFRRFITKYNKDGLSLDNTARQVLRSYRWPGNLRELRNCMERAIVVCDNLVLTTEHLPDNILYGAESFVDENKNTVLDLNFNLRNEYMRKIILEALARSGGCRNETAKLLKISRKTLYNRMKELGVKHEFT